MSLRKSAQVSLAIAILAWLPWGASGFLFALCGVFALLNASALIASLLRD